MAGSLAPTPEQLEAALARFLGFVEWPRVCEALAQHAESAPGKHAARGLLPALEPERVEAFQAATREADVLARAGALAPLRELSDLPLLFQRCRLEERGLDSRELYGVATSIQAGFAARAAYLASPRLAALVDQSEAESAAQAAQAEAIELAIGPFGAVLSRASEELTELRRRIAERVARLREELWALCQDGSVVLALIEPQPVEREGQPCLLVRAAELWRVPGPLLHQEGARYYVQPDALAAGYNELRDLHVAERGAASAIIRELSAQALAAEEGLAELGRGLIQADLHQAMARFAATAGLRPVLPSGSQGPRLRLEGARLPLLQDAEGCVPISLELSQGEGLLLISGPNGGGKTAAMKTLALCALLAQCGCAAPLEAGVLPVFSAFAAVADPRSSVSGGLSTFQAHARDLADALAVARPGALLLLDEIGRGTDPGEAAALAQATLEHLLDAGGVTALATTHLPELKRFARSRPDALCAAVALDAEGRPTFRLALGEVGRSYALEAARQAGLPESLCRRAAALHQGQELVPEHP